jgi:hypothetical protein
MDKSERSWRFVGGRCRSVVCVCVSDRPIFSFLLGGPAVFLRYRPGFFDEIVNHKFQASKLLQILAAVE